MNDSWRSPDRPEAEREATGRRQEPPQPARALPGTPGSAYDLPSGRNRPEPAGTSREPSDLFFLLLGELSFEFRGADHIQLLSRSCKHLLRKVIFTLTTLEGHPVQRHYSSLI